MRRRKMATEGRGEKRKMAPTEEDERKLPKVFNDPIHGNIELHPLLVKIIDTPQFQRLRKIKQLGGTYFVYPGASHNRFEHSIGVCHLAGLLVRALKDKMIEEKKQDDKGRKDDINKGDGGDNDIDEDNNDEKITPKEILCVEIAALCHDLGHGPFSHLFDGHIIRRLRKEKTWKHEEGSVDMFNYMLEVNGDLEAEFQRNKINEKDREFIREMIVGQKVDDCKESGSKQIPKYQGRPKKKFLYQIVSNKQNGIDVDKWDYFARDSYMLGMGNNFNYKRCIAFSKVIEVGGEKQICFRDKEVTNLYDMFHTRFLLHQRAYQHKTANIIEHMIADALVLANEFITFNGKDGADRISLDCKSFKIRISVLLTEKNIFKNTVRLSETIDDMKAFTLLNDSIIDRILEMDDKNEEIKESKRILKKVQCRDLYKRVGEKRFRGKPFKDEDDVKKGIKKILDGQPDSKRIKEEIRKNAVIDLVTLDYGQKDKDPIEYVNFYSKKYPNQVDSRKKKDVSPILQPTLFQEQVVRLYWKEKLNEAKHNEIETMFNEWAEKNVIDET